MRAEANRHREHSAQIAGIARAHGARVVEDSGDVAIGAERYAVFQIECRDNVKALELLNDFAAHDANDGEKVRRLAHALASRAPSDEAYARAVHRFVRDAIRYVDDPEQVFRSGDATIALGHGNCVNTARLIVGLARAAGLEARALPVPDASGAITHTCAKIRHDGAWHWAEATIGAQYGEEPHAAARRLGIEVVRTDLAGRGSIAVAPVDVVAALTRAVR